MKKHKLILPFALAAMATSTLPLVGCSKSTRECIITFQVEGEGSVNVNTLTTYVNSKWGDIKKDVAFSPNAHWMLGELTIDGNVVKDDTVIVGDCVMTINFIHNEEDNTLINFEVVDQCGSIEKSFDRFWNGYTFGQLKQEQLLPKTVPVDEYVFDNGWWLDKDCTMPVPDSAQVSDLSIIYVSFIHDPELYCHIEFVLNEQLGRIIDYGSFDVRWEDATWANVRHPLVRPAKGYYVSSYSINGLELVDDYLFTNNAVVQVNFKKTTDQSLFAFDFKDGVGTLTSYTGTEEENIIIPPYYYDSNGNAYPIEIIGVNTGGEGSSVFNSNLIKSVTFPEGVKVIDKTPIFGENCTEVSSISFPETITEFRGSLFAAKNLALTSLNIGKNVTTLYATIISNLPNITSLTINKLNTKYYDGRATGGKNCIIETSSHKLLCGCQLSELPSDLLQIASDAFNGSAIKNINIPSSVTVVGTRAFDGSALETVSFDINAPKLAINEAAFRNTKISSISLPKGCTTIGKQAFANTGVTHLHAPESLQTISAGAFSGCDIQSISIDPNNKFFTMGEDGENCLVKTAYGIKRVYFGCKNTVFPTDAIEVIQDAFNGNNISTLTLPEGYTAIGREAFYNCQSLTSVTLPSTLLSTGLNAFGGCTNVKTLDLSSFGTAFPEDSSGTSLLKWTNGSFGFNLEEGTVYFATGMDAENLAKWKTQLSNAGLVIANWTIAYK